MQAVVIHAKGDLRVEEKKSRCPGLGKFKFGSLLEVSAALTFTIITMVGLARSN